MTAREAWDAYLAETADTGHRGKPWGAHHRADHEKVARPGAPLDALLKKNLSTLDTETLRAWAVGEVKKRPTQARLAFRLLRAFLRWAAATPPYAAALGTMPDLRRVALAMGKDSAKSDALLKEQLRAWFREVQAIPNQTVSAYLQVLLLTGGRKSEVLELRWPDTDTRWRTMTLKDKVEGERVIPMTDYVAHLLDGLGKLDHVNEWCFASVALADDHMKTMNKPLRLACQRAGIAPAVTLHGLRRSFGSLSEWLDLPAGVVAQIQGHKPSATAEKHYRVRPVDLLREHLQRFENWLLDQAGVTYARGPMLILAKSA